MASKSLVALLATVASVEAHTRMVELFRGSAGQGEGVAVRMDLDSSTTTAPVTDMTSTDMVCGKNGLTAVGRTIELSAGDTISMLHRSWADGAEPGVIDSNHKGPTAVYLKKIAEPGSADPWTANGDGSGDGWFKISWDGLDLSDSTWGVDDMINSGGYTAATLPGDLSDGYYLVRDEVLSLQNRDGGTINPQFFIGCVQVYVSGGSGTAAPTTVAIPGHVEAGNPSVTYDINVTPLTAYPEFGPSVYSNPKATAAKLALHQLSAVVTDVVGLCPDNTVLQVGNKCYTEIPSWSNDTPGSLPACWAASDSCWQTNTECWADIEPVINGADTTKGCNLWQDKCNAIVAWCEAGNTSGPPDAGKVLAEPQDTSPISALPI